MIANIKTLRIICKNHVDSNTNSKNEKKKPVQVENNKQS